MTHGWAGTILRIDLTTREVSKESVEGYARKFVGGRGINVKIFYDETSPGASSLAPENPLIFGVGPLVGTGAPGCCRTDVISRSPAQVPELLGEGSFGGYWGPELKFAGYDNVVIKGKAETPVYVLVDNESVELEKADWIWGEDTIRTEAEIRKALNDEEIQVACIGPAGEKLVRLATIQHGNCASAKCGLGAVMGSKNLKAIAVRGSNKAEIADSEEFRKAYEELYKSITEKEFYESWSRWGSSKSVEEHYSYEEPVGIVGNYERQTWEKLPEIEGKPFVRKYSTRSWGCFGCPIHCRHFFVVPGVGRGVIVCSPYVSHTARIWNTDMKLMFEDALLCQKYGLGLLSMGSIIAWLMQLHEKGIITKKDTDGIAMERGSKEAILGTIHKTANREGFGDLLAEGPLKFAKKIGKGAEEYLIHKRGIMQDTIEFRALVGSALAIAVGARGDELRGGPGIEKGAWAGPERAKQVFALAKKMFGTEKAAKPWEYDGKGKAVAYFENAIAVSDILGMCRWIIPEGITFSHDMTAALFSAATGSNMNTKELLHVAERVIALERAFLVREGLSRADDKVPQRFFREPVSDGRNKGQVLRASKFEKMKDEYYTTRRWELKRGAPTQERLEELGLSQVANELAKLGQIEARTYKNHK